MRTQRIEGPSAREIRSRYGLEPGCSIDVVMVDGPDGKFIPFPACLVKRVQQGEHVPDWVNVEFRLARSGIIGIFMSQQGDGGVK